MFRENSFLMIYHLSNFNDLIESGFLVISKIIFANLFKPFHDAIIIPVSSHLLNLENEERKKNTKSLIPREQKQLFKENKNHFS